MVRTNDDRAKQMGLLKILFKCEFIKDKHCRWLFQYKCKKCQRDRTQRLWSKLPYYTLMGEVECGECERDFFRRLPKVKVNRE